MAERSDFLPPATMDSEPALFTAGPADLADEARAWIRQGFGEGIQGLHRRQWMRLILYAQVVCGGERGLEFGQGANSVDDLTEKIGRRLGFTMLSVRYPLLNTPTLIASTPSCGVPRPSALLRLQPTFHSQRLIPPLARPKCLPPEPTPTARLIRNTPLASPILDPTANRSHDNLAL
ncbi:hypothetical protein DFH09DRAFT_1080928 [Mycena vulgaris]|nr:hypothetical protein DFH09DRAFT_1080928 [Mycena vulgaris]